MTTVLWLRQDLRLHDHAGWRLAAQAGTPVLALYVLPPAYLAPGPAGFDRFGTERAGFLADTLTDLKHNLAGHGISLHTVIADPVSLFIDWHARAPLRLLSAAAPAWEEQQWFDALA